MKHTRTWTDVYGSPRASFEGRAGGTAGWSPRRPNLPPGCLRPWRRWTARALSTCSYTTA
ncbi:hypothetical protein [Deinococcus wulumuqiensis]|uniref:hypothetical protein n=1 Tax=Deinococcus wulumuqiensis TaxID=980427 RepID=UPI001F07E2BE|nr:hypothetical protein [Deinococcus wulumuqiensis]